MEGYFRTMESFYPEWRLNAKRIYGCRGFFSNARASNTCLLLHWGTWDGVFWTAGGGWLASFFSDYAAYTGNRQFLAKRVVPVLKETAQFYEDFLAGTEKDGRVTFIPSYNPETGDGINAMMDIAVARQVLVNLIAACRELKIEQQNIPKWEALLAKLPPYSITSDGQVPEFPGGGVAAGHRHHSQLYPCFQSFDPQFTTDAALRKAAQATVRTKIAGSDGCGEQSSFGRMQSGVSAAFLGVPGSLRPVKGDGRETLDESEPDHVARALCQLLQHRRQWRHPAHCEYDVAAEPRPGRRLEISNLRSKI